MDANRSVDELTLVLRSNVCEFIYLAILPNIRRGMRVLEIGPMQERWTPAYYVPMRDEVEAYGAVYEACDADTDAPAEYSCDAVDLLKYAPHLRGSYDQIIALEVLEHSPRVWDMPAVLSLLLKPGGRLYVSTPFAFRIHEPRPDLWRFTEDGLRALFEPHFSTVAVQSYGLDLREPLQYTMKAVR